MTFGFPTRDRKQKKLPKPQPSVAAIQASQSTLYTQHQDYPSLSTIHQTNGYGAGQSQRPTYPASPPPPFSAYPSPPQQHSIYGPTPRNPPQFHQPRIHQSQSYVADSTTSFASSPPQKDGMLKAQWSKAERLASKSYSDLTAPIKSGTKQSVAMVNKSVAMTNKGVSNLSSNYIEKPTVLVTKKSVQLLNQSAALCDRLSSKLDAVITSIDEGIFSGNEQDLMVEDDVPPPFTTTSSFQSEILQTRSAPGPYLAGNTKKSSNMFSKVWLYSNSRLPPHLPPFKVYMPTYPLVCLAAAYSERVYTPTTTALPITESETHVPADWRSGTKAMILKSLPRDDMNTIVFAIRGSQTFMDWAVNYRSDPTSPKGFLDDPGNACHAGFLYVAKKMISPVAERLRVLLQENPSRSNCSLLITGHSAGGAVAALLYAHMMSTTVESELSYLTGFFKRVHCITFGAPPVTLLPLKKSDDKRHHKSLFYSFINEGDPVPRADKAVVRNLLKLYSSSTPTQSYVSSVASLPQLGVSPPSQTTLQSTSTAFSRLGKARRSSKTSKTSLAATNSSTMNVLSPAWPVVPCALSNAGRLIVLRQRPGQGGADDIEAVTVDDETLRRVVYGDPVKHQMSIYKRRVELIATRAVTASD